MPVANDNLPGAYLKDRRTKLDPAAFGLPSTRRQTAGLRRQEVAQRANVSATWYTWLEQRRGGAPSANVIDRIARDRDREPGPGSFLNGKADRSNVGRRVNLASATTDRP